MQTNCIFRPVRPDHVFGEGETTERIHEAITRPIVHSVMEGINGELVAHQREEVREGRRKRETELVVSMFSAQKEGVVDDLDMMHQSLLKYSPCL